MKRLQRILEATQEVAVPRQEVRGSMNAHVEECRMLVGELVDDAGGLQMVKRLHEAVAFNVRKVTVVFSAAHITSLPFRTRVRAGSCRPYAGS